jgi:hypothetical protein
MRIGMFILAVYANFVVWTANANEPDMDGLAFVEMQRTDADVPEIRAVSVVRRLGSKTVISYSILDGTETGFLKPVAVSKRVYGNVKIQLYTLGQAIHAINIDKFLADVSTELSNSIQSTWPASSKYSLSVKLVLVPENYKVSDENVEKIKNRELKVRFFFRQRDVETIRGQMSIVQNVSHELYHLYANLFEAKHRKSRQKKYHYQQQYSILNEAAASVYGVCRSLAVTQQAIILYDGIVDLNGRKGTLDDAMLSRFLTTKTKIPGKDQPQIGMAIFHTIWVSANGSNWGMEANSAAGSYFQKLCSRPDFGSPDDMLPTLKVLATDGIDAEQLLQRPKTAP